MNNYQKSPLWKQAFYTETDDDLDVQRRKLITAFEDFRDRASLLVNQIHKDLPSLTVHDITHIDMLWWTASEIAGPNFPLNPAEAFVLGGAFLLHDAGHCLAAYSGGIDEIRKLPEWRASVAKMGLDDSQLCVGSEPFQIVLFDVLRTLHPKQARRLPKLHWSLPGDSTPRYLIAQDDLRESYGDIIGQIAESHWASPRALETLSDFHVNPPTFLHPAPWSVDVFKLALLLRTADAAHVDPQRAPRFLLALTQPEGISRSHWQFQSRLHCVKRDPDEKRRELRISSAPFPAGEQEAWQMAYDAAQLIDRELRAAHRLLLDHRKFELACHSVAGAYCPEDFSRYVPTDGWYPANNDVYISDVKGLVTRLAGESFYGDDPGAALRELLQNSADAINACRRLGGLKEEEGEIEVALDEVPEGYWLHVTDTGVGMSRYVLIDVLMDYGRSLWRSADLQYEWSGLASSEFESIGQFGQGFFSVILLSNRIRIVTRRYETKAGEPAQWLYEFTNGIRARPVLGTPNEHERLKKHGTRVSVLINQETFQTLRQLDFMSEETFSLDKVCAFLAPALDIDLFVRDKRSRRRVVKANDWLTLPPPKLLARIYPYGYRGIDWKSFGPWSHLSAIKDSHGKIVGRCAANVYDFEFSSCGETKAVGVVKGIRAGESVAEMLGIVFCKPQERILRDDADPDFSISSMSRWADEQKEILLAPENEEFRLKSSQLLINLCTSYEAFMIGLLDGKPISYEELVCAAENADKFIFKSYSSGNGYSLFGEMLGVRVMDKNTPFSLDCKLEKRAFEWLPRWESDRRSLYDFPSMKGAIESALRMAWGDFVWEKEEIIHAVTENKEIKHPCDVVRRRKKADR